MSDEIEQSITRALPDDVAAELANLARVPENSRVRFRELMSAVLEEAHLGNEIHHSNKPPIRATDVAHPLRRVAAAAQNLDRALGAFLGEDGSFGRRNAAPFAGSLLDIALDDAALGGKSASTLGFLPQLTAYRHSLATLIAATAEAKRRAIVLFPTRRGRPTGAGGNPMFDNFVKRLDEIASMAGGEWKHYRDTSSPGTEWKGTLMTALEILRHYLPATGFFPDADLGRCIEHVRERLKTDTTEIDSSTA